MKLHRYKSQSIYSIPLIIFGIVAATFVIYFTPTFATNYLSPDHNIASEKIK